MAIFKVLWPYLLTPKLRSLQKNNIGHTKVGGKKGAGFIARKLEESLNKENEKLSFILDEGLFVIDGVFPGVSDPVAYVGNDYINKFLWDQISMEPKKVRIPNETRDHF